MALDIERPDLIVGVVGAGAMGRGIVQLCLQAGIEVRLSDARPAAAGQAAAELATTFDRLAAKGRMAAEDARAAAARLTPIEGEAGFAGCHIVIEAIVEDLAVKQGLLARLEGIVGDDCILATNTSSLSVTAIASACRLPARVCGFHFFNPAPLMKVVEVIDGVMTGAAVANAMIALGRRIGHRPVRASDTPGFIVNHAGRGFGTEALRILQEGVASVEEIDRILRDLAGFRMGPFELLDLTGLDVSRPVMETIYEQFFHEPRFRPSYLLPQRQIAGLLGRKTGRGFYAYPGGQMQVPEAPAAPDGLPRPVWIGPMDPQWRAELAGVVAAAGWRLETGEAPGPDALILTAPLGRDAGSEALALGVDPARTVAVDMLFGLGRRRCFMTTVATQGAFRDSAHVLLATGGLPVSRLRDSAGFVSQRVVAAIVNIACEIAQLGIATPADIDIAVKLGLGYPTGPLSWGDAIGPRRLLAILDAIEARTGDPRYRASLWLRRRAELNLSLVSQEN